MGLFRTVSEINGDFSLKSHNFPPRVLCTPVEGVSLGIEYRHCVTRVVGLPAVKEV